MSLDLDLLTFLRFFQRLHACTARENGVSSGLGTRLLCPEKNDYLGVFVVSKFRHYDRSR